MNAQVLGISIDHIPCLNAWSESLGGITYPLLSDFWPHGAVAQQYGVLRPEGYSERAIFILDEEGIIQYIDIHDIDDQPDNEELFKVLRRLNPEAAERERAAAAAKPAPARTGDIILYCTNWCPTCRTARAWLEGLGISYTPVDVDLDPEAAAQVRKWANGNLTTPTYDIGGTIVVDFDENKLIEAIRAYYKNRK